MAKKMSVKRESAAAVAAAEADVAEAALASMNEVGRQMRNACDALDKATARIRAMMIDAREPSLYRSGDGAAPSIAPGTQSFAVLRALWQLGKVGIDDAPLPVVVEWARRLGKGEPKLGDAQSIRRTLDLLAAAAMVSPGPAGIGYRITVFGLGSISRTPVALKLSGRIDLIESICGPAEVRVVRALAGRAVEGVKAPRTHPPGLWLPREELAERAGLSLTTSYTQQILATLRNRVGVIVYRDRGVGLAPGIIGVAP